MRGDRSGAAAADRPGDTAANYIRMKHVQVVDDDFRIPAINAMIPTDWQFKGELRYLGGMGGCFADFKSLFIHAQNADDPDSNPNGHLSGNWQSLEPVQAAPRKAPAVKAGARTHRATAPHFGSSVSGTSVIESTGIAFALAAWRMAASSGAW